MEVETTRGGQVLEVEEEEEKNRGINREVEINREMRDNGMDKETDKEEEEKIDWEGEDDKFLNGK